MRKLNHVINYIRGFLRIDPSIEKIRFEKATTIDPKMLDLALIDCASNINPTIPLHYCTMSNNEPNLLLHAKRDKCDMSSLVSWLDNLIPHCICS